MKKLIIFISTILFLNLIPNIAFANDTIKCLTNAIYFESKGGSERDMKDVGHVVLNRTNNPKFPSNVCDVVYERTKRTCQFSWACKSHKVTEPSEYKKSEEYAAELLKQEQEGIRKDTTRGAMFFHSSRMSYGWNRSVCHTNKQHVFYK